MRKSIRSLAAALAAITAMSCVNVTAFADKLKVVDGVTYKYSDTGEQKGKYTGWAKNSKGKVYYKNGVKLKNCWLKVNGKRAYYLKSNSIMAVGDVEFKDGRTYHFEADGKLGRAPLIFAAVETNNAWVFYQKVTVVDSAGNIYWSGVYEDRSKEITFWEDDWYDKLLKNTASDVKKTISVKALKKIGSFLNDAEKYSSFDNKVYEYDDGDDGGITTIYGIYKDTDGKTKFIEICKYGDIYECIGNNDVEDFVNSMINEDEMRGFFGGCAGYNDLVDND